MDIKNGAVSCLIEPLKRPRKVNGYGADYAIRGKVKGNVTLNVKAPKMTASFNKDYVSHILHHLLDNAAKYTPLEFKIEHLMTENGSQSLYIPTVGHRTSS